MIKGKRNEEVKTFECGSLPAPSPSLFAPWRSAAPSRGGDLTPPGSALAFQGVLENAISCLVGHAMSLN